MKRLFTISFIALALVVGVAGAAPAAHAAVCAPGYIEDVNGNAEQAADGTPCTPDTSSGTAVNAVADEYGVATPPPDPVAAKAVAGGLPPDPSGSEGFSKVIIWIMGLFAWLVGVAVLTLDYSVYYTVVAMGNYVNNLSAVGVTWQIMRDIGNIVIIFGFLAIGICTILDVKWYGGGTKMLPMLLVGAVFLNFSLFFTEAIIDTGNLFATQFYTQIKGGQMPTQATLSQTTIENEGVSNKIMSQLGFQNIYGELRNTENAKKILAGGNQWVVGFMGILLFLITAFVMFSLAFILIARFVILLFLIIIAPIGFAGLAIPNLSGLAKKWWDKLVEQTITAPILLLCLYIALRIITDVNFLTGFRPADSAPDWFGTIRNNAGAFAPLLLSFLVAMGLLIAVVIISKQLSAFGADKASALAGKLSFGATAWAGRGVAGTLVGRGLLGNRFIKRGAVSDNRFVKGLSRVASFTGKRLQNRTFDIRNMPGSKAGLGLLGVDAGTASQLTAKDLQEKEYGRKPVKEFFRQSDIEHEQAAEELKRKAALAGTNPDEISRALAKMTTKEIEELGGIKNGVDKLVNNLSPQQFEALMKSDKLSEVEKGRIKTTRYKPLDDARRGGNPVDIRKAIGNLSKGELESMPPELLASPEVLNNLNDKQRDTLTDSKERTADEKRLVKRASKVGQLEAMFNTPAPGAGAGAASALVAGLNKQQAAKLDRDVLVHPAISTVLTPDMLRAILREDKLIPADLALIKANVLAGGLLSSQDYLNTGPDRTLWP